MTSNAIDHAIRHAIRVACKIHSPRHPQWKWNAMSDSMGNSHTPHSILHSPAERLENSTSPEPVDNLGSVVVIRDVLAEMLDREPGTRHPRVRIGERDPIPLHVRAAVWYRDKGRCDECPQDYQRSDAIHMDHIKPWSAGGADTTDNLRVLCEPHNLERSNFVDGARPKRPATWWCHRCHEQPYEVYGDKYLVCPIHNGPNRCRPARRVWAWEDASWFMVPAPEDYPHIAYCAHCDAPGMTGVLL